MLRRQDRGYRPRAFPRSSCFCHHRHHTNSAIQVCRFLLCSSTIAYVQLAHLFDIMERHERVAHHLVLCYALHYDSLRSMTTARSITFGMRPRMARGTSSLNRRATKTTTRSVPQASTSSSNDSRLHRHPKPNRLCTITVRALSLSLARCDCVRSIGLLIYRLPPTRCCRRRRRRR